MQVRSIASGGCVGKEEARVAGVRALAAGRKAESHPAGMEPSGMHRTTTFGSEKEKVLWMLPANDP